MFEEKFGVQKPKEFLTIKVEGEPRVCPECQSGNHDHFSGVNEELIEENRVDCKNVDPADKRFQCMCGMSGFFDNQKNEWVKYEEDEETASMTDGYKKKLMDFLGI